MTLTRRDLLAAAAAAPAIGLAASPLAQAAAAPRHSGYKALVCVFLAGGMDGHDTLIPTDPGLYRDWARRRAPLLTDYERTNRPRSRDLILPVGEDASGAPYGLPPEMPQLAAAIRDGKAAVIANVGPLKGPVTKAQLRAQSVPLPPKLFSHSDQQDYWHALQGDTGVPTGWGGRIADALGVGAEDFGAIAAGRDQGFLSGSYGPGLSVANFKARPIFGTDDALWGDRELAALFTEHLNAVPPGGGFLERDYASRQRLAASVNQRLVDMLASTKDGEVVAGRAGRGSVVYKLGVVAKMIALREQTEARRQIFFVELDGFDTHRDQPRRLAPVQARLDKALARFWRWVEMQGLADAVTVFTASDFGRTLVPNRTGTDHGWGNHHFVLGGAVSGGIKGEVPPPVTGHALDGGRGRLIPSLAVEQMGVPLARWLGVPESDLGRVFPFANRFDANALDLVTA